MSGLRWKVWAVIGRRGPPPHERYIIAIHGDERGAETQKARWQREYPQGVCDVQSYWIVNGQQPGESHA